MIRWRYLPFYLILIFSFWLLIFRLFDLTIVRGRYFRELSEGNQIREKVIRAPRGIIYDRKGQVLTRNVVVYKRCQISNIKCQILTREEALRIETKGGSEAAELQVDLEREYPWGGLFAHVLGYTGEVTNEEIRNSQFAIRNYKMGDRIGRTGVEEQYDEILRGIDGKELIEVDAQGRKITSLGEIPSKPGQNLTLSLDLDLQKVAAAGLEGKTGVVLVSAPATGEILVLYSSPSFNPNVLDEKIFIDPQKPMFNRAIAGLYPPGSTFKIVTAVAGLETGKITSQTQIEDVGEIVIGPYRYPNWYWAQYGRKEGVLDIVGAIKRSNDIFFYKVGEWVGIENLAAWAEKFGVGKISGIDLPGEAAGVVPKPQWRKKTLGRDWFLGDTYHVAIGQGDLQVTPLEMNFWTAVIANGGKLCKPTVIKTQNSKLKTQNCQDIGLKKETIDLIREGMKEACRPGGTGWPLFDFEVKSKSGEARKIETACKTGTAEYGDPKGQTHAWFTVFAWPAEASAKAAPTEEPEIVITVLVEGGGEGSNVAAPIAKKILEEWFGR